MKNCDIINIGTLYTNICAPDAKKQKHFRTTVLGSESKLCEVLHIQLFWYYQHLDFPTLPRTLLMPSCWVHGILDFHPPLATPLQMSTCGVMAPCPSPLARPILMSSFLSHCIQALLLPLGIYWLISRAYGDWALSSPEF